MSALLSLRGVTAHYGASQALFGIDLDIGPGEFVTLLGRNGMGKSTTVKTVMGLNRASQGSIVFDGRDISRLPAYKVAQCGIGLVPEGRHICPNLSVRENLVATAAARHGPARWTLPRIYALFPRLLERRVQPDDAVVVAAAQLAHAHGRVGAGEVDGRDDGPVHLVQVLAGVDGAGAESGGALLVRGHAVLLPRAGGRRV